MDSYFLKGHETNKATTSKKKGKMKRTSEDSLPSPYTKNRKLSRKDQIRLITADDDPEETESVIDSQEEGQEDVPKKKQKEERRFSSPSTTPTLSSESTDSDSDDETISEEDLFTRGQRIQFQNAFFSQNTPFTILPKRDGYKLDSTIDGANIQNLPYDSDLVQFGRNIALYTDDSFVTKHCAPWGEPAAGLNKDTFQIMKKIYTSNGELDQVMIKSIGEPRLEFYIDEPFFAGWCDLNARKAYAKFI